jgi:hypothetical protein
MNVENILGVYQMTNSTTFPGEVNIPSNSTFKIGDSVPAFLAGVTSVSVSEGTAGSDCSVAVGGNATAKSLTFTIPKGANGPNGAPGQAGQPGPAGNNGPPGGTGPPGNNGPPGGGGPTGPSPYGTAQTPTNSALQSNYYIRSNGYQYLDNAGTDQTFWARVYNSGRGPFFHQAHYSIVGGQRGYAAGSNMGGGAVENGRIYYGDDSYSTQYNIYQFNPAISMYGAYYLRCAGLNARSDERFKTDIKTLDTEKALKKIHNIRPVSYYNKEGSAFEIGFIAQEVEKELPQSIIDTTDAVSNINRVGSFSNKREAFTSQPGEEELNVKCSKYTFTFRDKTWPTGLELSDLALLQFKTVVEKGEKTFGGEYRRDVCGEPHNQRGFGQIDVLIDDVGEGCELPEGIKQDDEVYLLNGTIEYDSKILKYDDIFTVLTAAVQELDKQLQLDLEWIERLESKLN